MEYNHNGETAYAQEDGLLTPDELLAWADPDRNEFLGHAFSEENLTAITQEVSFRRRAFVINAIKNEISAKGRQGANKTMHTEEAKFSDLPVKPFLQRNDHIRLAVAMQNYQTYYDVTSATELKTYWSEIANNQAKLMGFRPWVSKNNLDIYLPSKIARNAWSDYDEEQFQAACEASDHLGRTGYPIRMLMKGVQYVSLAAIDLTTVSDWLEMRDKMDDPILKYAPYDFWPEMVKAKEQYDKFLGYSTYQDVVEKLGESVFVAPYVPEEVGSSAGYITADDVYAAARSIGETEANSTRAFRHLVYLAIDCAEISKQVRLAYFKNAQLAKPGVVFVHIDALEKAINNKAERGNGTNNVTELIIEELGYNLGLVDDYDKLVFDRANYAN